MELVISIKFKIVHQAHSTGRISHPISFSLPHIAHPFHSILRAIREQHNIHGIAINFPKSTKFKSILLFQFKEMYTANTILPFSTKLKYIQFIYIRNQINIRSYVCPCLSLCSTAHK